MKDDPVIFDKTGQPITRCCKSTPILYLDGAASCSKCGQYYSGVFLTGRFPSLVSKSPADDKATSISRAGKRPPSIGNTRDAKAEGRNGP